MDKSLYSRRSNLVIVFHGCDKTVVDAVVAGKTEFVSAIQIASRVIFFLEVSIKIILTHNIKWCILLAPYIGQARIHLFLFSSLASNIFRCFLRKNSNLSPHFLATFKRKAYLCSKKKLCQQYSSFSVIGSCSIRTTIHPFMFM